MELAASPIRSLMDGNLPAANARYYHAMQACAAVCGAIGILVLCGGWCLGVESLRRPSPAWAEMKANTAAALLMAGCALACAKRRSAPWRLAGDLCAALVLLVGVGTALEYLFGWNPGLDEILAHDLAAQSLPGRPSPAAAVAFTLLGCGLLLAPRKRWAEASQAMAVTTGVLSILNLAVRLFGVQDLMTLPSQTRMAAHTAASLLLLSGGI